MQNVVFKNTRVIGQLWQFGLGIAVAVPDWWKSRQFITSFAVPGTPFEHNIYSMIQALEAPEFFTSTEKRELQSINLAGTEPWDNREVFGTLMLAAILELTTADGVTTPAEFQYVEEFLTELESKYELTTREKLEGSGASMGLLPFLSTQWPQKNFHIARNILGQALDRLGEEDAHEVRNSIARVCRHAVKATAGFMYLAGVDKREKSVLHDMIASLKLDQCAEGLKLIGRNQ